jgi:hypothetical protein
VNNSLAAPAIPASDFTFALAVGCLNNIYIQDFISQIFVLRDKAKKQPAIRARRVPVNFAVSGTIVFGCHHLRAVSNITTMENYAQKPPRDLSHLLSPWWKM